MSVAIDDFTLADLREQLRQAESDCEEMARELAGSRATPDQAKELTNIAVWMRTRAADLLRQCSARKQAAACMGAATASELKEAAKLATRTSSRDVKAMTVNDAKESASRDSTIADRLEAEAAKLSAWADLLDRLAAPRNPPA